MLIKNKNLLHLIFLMSCVFLLVSCSKSKGTTDLQDYMNDLKKHAIKDPGLLKQFYFRKIPDYKNVIVRSPFSDQNIERDLKLLTSPSLERYPLDALHLVGIIQEERQTFAVIEAPNHKVYKITLGETIGNQHAKVISISLHDIVVEQSELLANQEVTQKVTLRLKD